MRGSAATTHLSYEGTAGAPPRRRLSPRSGCFIKKSTPRPRKTQIGQEKQTAQSPRKCQRRTPTPYPPQTFHEKPRRNGRVKVNAAHTIRHLRAPGLRRGGDPPPRSGCFLEKSPPRPRKTQIGQEKQSAQNPRKCQRRTPPPYPPQALHEKPRQRDSVKDNRRPPPRAAPLTRTRYRCCSAA